MNSKNIFLDLSFYRLSLLDFLYESHPMLTYDEKFISARAEAALNAYEQAVVNGSSPIEAEREANEVLFFGLHFSKHDMLKNILWNEFSKEIPEDEAAIFTVKFMGDCESIFAKYTTLSDDFAYLPEYDILYTELTGKIAILIETDNP